MTIKALRPMINMEQLSYPDLANHMGETVWFCPTDDCITVHGPLTVGMDGNSPVLIGTGYMIKIKDLSLNTFWRIPK